MKTREYTMENPTFQCKEYICEKTGIILEEIFSEIANIHIQRYMTDPEVGEQWYI
jgi:hypothetical protein